MKTVLELIKWAGGWHPGLYLKINNPPYLELVIEALDESGPCGLPAISVAHYSELNGDAMRDPEMCFELDMAGGPHLSAFYYQRLRRRRAMVALYPRGAVRRSHHAPPRTGTLRRTVGQEPQCAAIRGSFHGQVHSWLVRSHSERNSQHVSAPQSFTLNRSKGAQHHGNANHERH